MTAKNKAAVELGRMGGKAGKGKPKNAKHPKCKTCGGMLRRDKGCTKCEKKAGLTQGNEFA
jgi:hypothetical protein